MKTDSCTGKREEGQMNAIMATAVYCIVGCNTGAPDGQSLHVVECNAETGAMSLVQTVKGIQGTNYFCLDRDGSTLYSYVAKPIGRGYNAGVVVRFPFKDGRLGAISRVADIPGGVPCHISISPDGVRLGYACYGSATAGTLSIAGGNLRDVTHDRFGLGPNRRRQEKPHAHSAVFTPDGMHVGVADLGKDRIFFYGADTMAPVPAMTIAADPGDGPRHSIWSRDGRFLFVVNELSSTVMSFAFDGVGFSRVGKWSMLPENCPVDSKAAAIKLTADGRVLMASNRGYDSIAFYDVDAAKGTLSLRNIAKIDGSFPRDFELMPNEKFMIVGHKKSDEICMYRFDRKNCSLEPVGDRIKAWKPLCFVFAGKRSGS